MNRILVAFLAVACAFGASAGTIFLNGAVAESGDGTAWSTAYKTWDEAIAALKAVPSGEAAVLKVAAGVYGTAGGADSTSGATTLLRPFEIHGGYRAVDDNDDFCDPEAYHSVIAAYSNPAGLAWRRLTPVEGERRCLDQTEVKVLDGDGKLQLPAFTNRHDAVAVTVNMYGTPTLALCLRTGSSGSIDGLKFIGFSKATAIAISSGAENVVISNCVFAANKGGSGIIKDTAGTVAGRLRLITHCLFYGNGFESGTRCIASSGNTTVRRCSFVGNFRGNVKDTNHGMELICFSDGSNTIRNRTVEDCVFTRNLYGGTSDDGSKPALIYGSGLFRNLVITNNYGWANGPTLSPLICINKTKSNGAGTLTGCLIADNRFECVPKDDSVQVVVSGFSNYYADKVNNNPLVENCVFRDNEIVSTANTMTEGGTCAIGLLGNYNVKLDGSTKYSTWMTVVGCSFISNRVTVSNLPAGATVLRSRGVVSFCKEGYDTQYGLANCTFYGARETGLYDIVQFGVHQQTMNVVNCLFSDDDPTAVTRPIYATTPSFVSVRDCAVKNLRPALWPTDYANFSGVTDDPVPLEAVPFGVGAASVLRSAAKVPDIRLSCDIATNRQSSALSPITYAFRPRGGAWQSLVPMAQALAANEKTPSPDALGALRPFGATTRGALQALSPVAETGVTLTLRMDPPLSGRFSGPASQSVPTGTATAPVSFIHPDGLDGWYDTGDVRQSTDNPLVISALAADTILTAKPALSQVTLVFRLGDHASFAGGGHEWQTAATPGVAVTVPAFTVDEGYHFVKWPGFDGTAPETDAAFDAKIVTKAMRTVYVATTAAGKGDGSSPDDPTDDLAAAYEDASSYRGEVRMKGGVYRLSAPLELQSNVEVVGGSDGSETILTGDVNGDDFWKAEDADPAGPVWTGTTFNEPNPAGTAKYWAARSANANDNLDYAFVASLGKTATNMLFRAVTFTGFAKSAVYVQSDSAGPLAFADCRFLANGTARNASVSTIQADHAVSLALDGCSFVGNYRGVSSVFDADRVTNTVANCTFRGNSGLCLAFDVQAVAVDRLQDVFAVTNCLVTNCWSSGALFMSVTSVRRTGLNRVSDCRLVGNRPEASFFSVVGNNATASGSNLASETDLLVERCDISYNRRTGDASPLVFASLYTGRDYAPLFVDCSFCENVLTNTTAAMVSFVRCDGGNRPTFVGCTVSGNEIVSTEATARTVLFCCNALLSGCEMHGLVFANNRLIAASGRASVLYDGCDQQGRGMRVYSTVIDERSGLPPIATSAGAVGTVFLENCVLSGHDDALCEKPVSMRDCLLVASGGSAVQRRAEIGPNGVRSLALGGATDCRLAGTPIWFSNGGNNLYYFYNKRDREFYPLGSLGYNGITAQQARERGIALDLPSKTDAWGRVRRCKMLTDEQYGNDLRTAPGPLNPNPRGMMLIVR